MHFTLSHGHHMRGRPQKLGMRNCTMRQILNIHETWNCTWSWQLSGACKSCRMESIAEATITQRGIHGFQNFAIISAWWLCVASNSQTQRVFKLQRRLMFFLRFQIEIHISGSHSQPISFINRTLTRMQAVSNNGCVASLISHTRPCAILTMVRDTT